MKLFCDDKTLNLSPYYLSPGFAYGGSCLSKDTEVLIKESENLNIETPLLHSIPISNTEHIGRAIELIKQENKKNIGFLGLSFKPGTDDKRSNPIYPVMSYFEVRDYDVKKWDKYERHDALHEVINQDLIVISSRDKELMKMAKERVKKDTKIINLQE
jgi:GDP-mannose 6-dehydrogenase